MKVEHPEHAPHPCIFKTTNGIARLGLEPYMRPFGPRAAPSFDEDAGTILQLSMRYVSHFFSIVSFPPARLCSHHPLPHRHLDSVPSFSMQTLWRIWTQESAIPASTMSAFLFPHFKSCSWIIILSLYMHIRAARPSHHV